MIAESPRRAASLRCASLLLSVIVFVCTPVWPCAGQDHVGEKMGAGEFREKYRQALIQLQSLYSDAQIEGIEITTSWRPDSTEAKARPPGSTEFTYVSCANQQKMRYRRATPEYFDRWFINDGNRQFTVRSPKPNAPYYLEAAVDSIKPKSDFWRFKYTVKNAAFCIGNLDFSQYVTSPEFKILETSEVGNAGESLVRLTFEYLPSEKTKPQIKGFIVLNSSRMMVVQSYEFSIHPSQQGAGKPVSTDYQCRGSIRYREGSEPPIPLQVDFYMIKQVATFHSRYYISKFKIVSSPQEDFTLASFGLGDFQRPSARGVNRVAYYAMAVAIAAFAIGFILYRVSKSLRGGRPAASGGSPSG